MKITGGALVREQNENDVDDSAFDSSEYQHMCQKLEWQFPCHEELNLEQFIIEGKLQRHPQTKFMNDISSDQAHMFILAGKDEWFGNKAALQIIQNNYRTSNGNWASFGLCAEIGSRKYLRNLSLLVQMFFFLFPVRWCDGENPDLRCGFVKLNLGYRSHCGDYRLFKQCLYYAPWILRRMVSRTVLKRMTRLYWAPEPNIQWLIDIDDRFIEECL